MLDQGLAETMQRVLSKDVDRFSLTGALERLIEAGIGTKRGKSAYFNDKDRNEMRAWLKAKGFSDEPASLAEMPRGDRLDVTPFEKAGGAAVKQRRIAVKAIKGHALKLNGESLLLPIASHLDIDWEQVVQGLGHNCIMVVENYENFNRIHECMFQFAEPYLSPLVVYRGDPHESRIENVMDFLAAANLPVFGFVDADPAGMIIAASLPRLAGLIAPILTVLEAQLASPITGRRDLFHDQYPVMQKALMAITPDHLCWPVLNLILKHRSGVVQERWIGHDPCHFISI